MSTATRSLTRGIFSPRLGLARVLCVLVIAASLSVMLAATPLDWNRTLNDPATRDSMRVFGLEPVGPPFALYAAYLFLLKYAALFVSIIFALVILIRRPNSVFALFVAATLALVPHIYSSDNWIDWWLYPAPWDHILQTLSSALAYATPFFFSGLLYLFPSGRFEPRWARTVFILIFALFFGMALFSLAGSGPPSDLPDTGWLVFVFLFFALCTSGVASLIFRYRRVLKIHERQQTRWVFIGMSAVAVWFALLLLGLDGLSDEPVIILLLIHLKVLIPTLIPLTIGISILRYGLWDMDPLLNRTLVYGMLSAVIVGLYVLVVGGLGSLIHANGSGWLAVLVTGLVAILFAPLRERLQRAVNRLMYGERDDPLTLIEHLGEELRAVVAPLLPREGKLAADRAAVEAAGAVPVTIKFRIGIDERYPTFLEAGRIGQEEGCAAVGLHARTAAQLYDGAARWDAIAELKRTVTRIPVLGNGDVGEAEDALRMLRATGCDGVIVGRGCLGRPWLFRDLADVFEGREPRDPPSLGGVLDVMLEHARLLAAWLGDEPAAGSHSP